MKKIMIYSIVLLVAILMLGCAKIEPEQELQNNQSIEVPESVKDFDRELTDKRGEQTDIQEWSELVRRASAIQSWEFTVADTENAGQLKVYQLARYQTVEFEGKEIDVVQMDRITKKALSRCKSCEEKNLELVDYDKYHQLDPYEMMTLFREAEFLKTDNIGNDYVKVFKGIFGGEPATISVQEYYGYPLKIESKTRKIVYTELMIDNTRRKNIAIPFDSIIEGKKYWSWEHYLGLMETRGGIDPAVAV